MLDNLKVEWGVDSVEDADIVCWLVTGLGERLEALSKAGLRDGGGQAEGQGQQGERPGGGDTKHCHEDNSEDWHTFFMFGSICYHDVNTHKKLDLIHSLRILIKWWQRRQKTRSMAMTFGDFNPNSLKHIQ